MSSMKAAQKVAIFEAANWICAGCGGHFPDPPWLNRPGLGNTDLWRLIGNHLTIDHRIPLAQGGTNVLANLQAMCYVCNNGKGDGIRPNSYPGTSQKAQKKKRRRRYNNASPLVQRLDIPR